MARDPWEELAEALVHGSEEAFVAELTERMMALFERGCANPDEFAAIASRAREAALGVWAEFRGRVSEDTESAFMEALSREQELVEASLAEAFGGIDPALTARGRNEVAQAARGMATIVERQNVALADNLADEWWEATSDAVTRIQLGDALEDVVRDGARRLADAGIETIDYKSGARTSVDAAVRRHAITQQNQCRNDMLVRECHEYGVDLVFTSAHYGARPEHAAWQGKPCGLDGPCEVDGVRYPGLVELTGYGTVTGLCGANCRHRLTPYIPGLSELPDTEFAEFEAKYHMSSDEYYEATQRQRALERQIRATKREIALGEAHGADMTEDRYRLGAQQKRLREHCRRTGLPRDYAREQAYAVADKDGAGVAIFHQPRALTAKPASPSPFVLRSEKEASHTFIASNGQYNVATVRDVRRVSIKGGQTLYISDSVSQKYQADLIKQFRKLPKAVKATVSTIEVVDYNNPADPYWRKRYRNFTVSAATGGRSIITIYAPGLSLRGVDLLGLIAHEGGHCFDDWWRAAHGESLSDSRPWDDAVSEDYRRTGNTWVTAYARGSRSRREDLADALKLQVRSVNRHEAQAKTRNGTIPVSTAYSSRFDVLREVLDYDRSH